MEKVILSKGAMLVYFISMALTFLVIVRVDSLNNKDITNIEDEMVYNTEAN